VCRSEKRILPRYISSPLITDIKDSSFSVGEGGLSFTAWGRHDRVWSQVPGRFRSPSNHG